MAIYSCSHCGQPFTSCPSWQHRTDGLAYCSRECTFAARPKRHHCAECGVVVLKGRRYCGQICRSAHDRKLATPLFWALVQKTDGCWIWTGRVFNESGYGASSTSLDRYAHRAAYRLTRGDIPAGLQVCHTCDNPICVNPEHLFLGTAGDNVRDSVNKGRFSQWMRTGQRLDGSAAPDLKKSHCHRGHPLDGDNLYVAPNGKRNCRACNRLATTRYQQRRGFQEQRHAC